MEDGGAGKVVKMRKGRGRYQDLNKLPIAVGAYSCRMPWLQEVATDS